MVAIALFGQRGQQGFLALKDSGIATPNDWEGRTFGYKVSIPPDYLAIVEAQQVDRSAVQEVRVGFDPRVLTEGRWMFSPSSSPTSRTQSGAWASM